MKENIKRIINLIILIALAIVTFLFVRNIPSMLIGKEANINQIEKVEEETYAMAPNDSTFGIGDGASLKTESEGGHYTRVIYKNEQIYCSQKGGTLTSKHYTYAELVGKLAEYMTKPKNKCMRLKWLDDKATLVTNPYYRKGRSIQANPMQAYVLTWNKNAYADYNEWTGVKQEAVWDKIVGLEHNIHDPSNSANGDTADKIVAQGEKYQSFYNAINANGGKIKKGNGYIETDPVANSDNKSGNKEYTIGPFKLNYIDGNYDNITFGGITKMYVVGSKTKEIKIKKFIIDGESVEPKFFEPEGLLYTSEKEQGYPKPGKEFSIVIDTTDEELEKLHVEVKYLKKCEAQIQYYDGWKYGTKELSHHHDNHYTTDPINNARHLDYYRCIFKVDVDKKPIDKYQELISVTGSRTPGEDKWDIPIDLENDDNENLQFDLAGFVWEEKDAEDKSGKNIDGIKNNDDIFKEGVEVTLYYADHGKAGQKVNKDANRKNLKNPYVTGYDGYYVFKDLDSKYKYYIEYTYDGQLYQATKYSGFKLPTETYKVGSNKFDENNVKFDKNNPEINSNGIEYKNTRTDFNSKFATIESAPQSYEVRRPLYMEKGKRNTAYIIGKTSEETPYGIKEIYDYVKEEAIKENYKIAYEKALSKFGNNNTTKSKLQFIEDCRITAYSVASAEATTEKTYPIFDKFAEVFEGKRGYTQDDTVEGMSVKWKKGTGKRYYALYPKHLNIDFGLTRRQEFDMALIKDVQKATIEINGKSQTYRYDQRDKGKDSKWEIDVRLSDTGYFKSEYTREIFPEDYEYKLSMYNGLTPEALKDKSELEVYITYKLLVYNQTQKILGEIREVVDYFDEDLEYVDNRSYIYIENEGTKPVQAAVVTGPNDENVKLDYTTANAPEGSIYGRSNMSTIAGYDKLYITGLQGHKFNDSEVGYIVLTFKVKKDAINGENWIKLDENIAKGEPIGVGKENIAEINGFKTYYDNVYVPNVGNMSNSVSAGLLDRDSVPGNLNPTDVPKDGSVKYENFEDDTDKAPNTIVKLYRDGNNRLLYRQIDGIVWEDIRNQKDNTNNTAVGNGIKDESNTEINGVTVQLVELMNNGEEFIWQQFSSGQNNVNENDKFLPVINLDVNNGVKYVRNSAGLVSTPDEKDGALERGKYIFRSYAPGNYVVRFIYGDNQKTVLPESNEVTNILGINGQNTKSYNGQDYKSTTYQKDIKQPIGKSLTRLPDWNVGNPTYSDPFITIDGYNDPYSNNSTVNEQFNGRGRSYLYGITESDAKDNVSDAKDIESRRNAVINYSKDNVTNRVAEVLASHKQVPEYNNNKYSQNDMQNMLNEFIDKTYMVADTGLIVAEIEYDRDLTDYLAKQGDYKIKNVNLGLEERPKAQLLVDKTVTNVKLTLADGSTLFDATDKATNVLWQKHDSHDVNMNRSEHRIEPYADGQLYKLRTKTAADAIDSAGLIQLSMDSELMHGATIKISYEITVRNVGEVDFHDDNTFYYKGVVSKPDNIVTTTPNKLVDYVGNNLQFYAVDNNAWETIKVDGLIPADGHANTGGDNLVNSLLREKVNKFNTIITTKDGSESSISNTDLKPEILGKGTSSVTDKLVLTQTITSENDTDDLTYRNLVELVKTSNTVGRRMEVSVVGNQDPSIVTSGKNVSEIDSDIAQVVKILPPFGNSGQPYVIAAIVLASSLILITGIVFIRKKILK